jgi:hemoglobin-like flavoprotein
MNPRTRELFEQSLRRCDASPRFLDLFYERFLTSSPEVAKKFVNTDFVKQKRALRASLERLLMAAGDEVDGPERYLSDIADRHGAGQLDIGAELYDLWLDSLIATVKQCDPQFSPDVEKAWETVMMVGIHYLCKSYGKPGPP